MQSYVNVLNSTDLHIKNDKFMLCVFITIKKKKATYGARVKAAGVTAILLLNYVNILFNYLIRPINKFI